MIFLKGINGMSLWPEKIITIIRSGSKQIENAETLT